MTRIYSVGILPPMAAPEKTASLPLWKRELLSALENEWGGNMKALSKAAGLGETYVRDVLKRRHEPQITPFIKLMTTIGRSPGAIINDESVPLASATRAAPLLNWISAGKMAEASPTPPSDKVFFVTDLGPGDYFALQVQGTSMNRISPDGSIIIINRRETQLSRGKPYVFSIRGEATYKLWEPDPARLEPDSTEPSNKPIFVKDKNKLFVVGRVRRTILDL